LGRGGAREPAQFSAEGLETERGGLCADEVNVGDQAYVSQFFVLHTSNLLVVGQQRLSPTVESHTTHHYMPIIFAFQHKILRFAAKTGIFLTAVEKSTFPTKADGENRCFFTFCALQA
jgi:hypothetical protein